MTPPPSASAPRLAPDLFRCAFEARRYDIDGSQAVRPRVFMDWMEHARAQVPASDAVFDALNFGLCRAFRLSIHGSVDGPGEVSAAVWVSRVGRTSYDIDHELVAAADHRLLCRGRMTMVAVGPDRRPAPAPRTLEGRVRGAALTFPASGEPGTSTGAPTYERRLTVTPSDENRGRHASHTRLVDHLEDTRRLGALMGAFGSVGERLGGPPLALGVVYEGEAHAGQMLVARARPVHGRADAVDVELATAAEGRPIARGRVVVP